jgi:hypothetical protein
MPRQEVHLSFTSGEAVSKSFIDDALLTTLQHHNSSMVVYQKIKQPSKQAGSLILGKSQV